MSAFEIAITVLLSIMTGFIITVGFQAYLLLEEVIKLVKDKKSTPKNEADNDLKAG